MSKRAFSGKHAKDEYESDGGFVEDAPKSKKQKKEVNTALQKDEEGNEYWELSGKRRVQVSEFKGTTMLGVREYYEKDGKTLPGKKGISLSMDQYRTFITLLPDIERVLEAKGISVPRPQYDKANSPADDMDENGEAESSKRTGKGSKPNHEATSDEDEE